MSAAVKHLTPITLELGGKCPAIIDSLTSSWDKEVFIMYISYFNLYIRISIIKYSIN